MDYYPVNPFMATGFTNASPPSLRGLFGDIFRYRGLTPAAPGAPAWWLGMGTGNGIPALYRRQP